MHSASISTRSEISKAAVFCPARRNSLTLLTSAIGWRSTRARTRRSAWSKLPRSATTRARRRVEVAPRRTDARAVHEPRGELARRDLALGHDDRAAHPGLRGVRRRAG